MKSDRTEDEQELWDSAYKAVLVANVSRFSVEIASNNARRRANEAVAIYRRDRAETFDGWKREEHGPPCRCCENTKIITVVPTPDPDSEVSGPCPHCTDEPGPCPACIEDAAMERIIGRGEAS